jgi:hypothetical protein
MNQFSWARPDKLPLKQRLLLSAITAGASVARHRERGTGRSLMLGLPAIVVLADRHSKR